MTDTQKGQEFRLRHGIMLPQGTLGVLKGYKDPLTRVQGGFGYVGTIAYNESGTHVQCHKCGFFFKSLGPHVARMHAMTSRDYKDRYGLMRSTSLGSPVYIARMRQRASNLEGWISNQSKSAPPYKPPTSTPRKRSPELLNKLGRCPEQLLHKIAVIAEAYDCTPTRRDFIEWYGDNGDLNMLYLTFGSWNEAIKILGLTPNHKGRKPRGE